MIPSVYEPSPDLDQRTRVDTVLAIVAAVAMLAFAWSGFQGAQWVRERFQFSDDAAAASEQALELAAEADRLQDRDTVLFIEWLVAADSGDQETADIVFGLFRPEVKSWVLSVDLDEAESPTDSLIDNPAYDVNELRARSEQLEEVSDIQAARSREASETGARYGGLGLLFAVVLASVGIASRFEHHRIRSSLLVVSLLLLGIGIAALVVTPISLRA